MDSINYKGEVLDFKYKLVGDFTYRFYIGDIYIGQIYRTKRYWSCVSREPNKLCPVSGFKTRYHAAEFLLSLIEPSSLEFTKKGKENEEWRKTSRENNVFPSRSGE